MRLLTRPDLDGLTCGVLLSLVEPIDQVIFVEPHTLNARQIEVQPQDIIANLPYHPACGMWFDHHVSNALPPGTVFKGAYAIDPSAARTIYRHYQHPAFEAYRELLEATDRVDAAQLTLEDVLNPQDYVLLSLTLDPRSNLNNTEQYYHLLLDLLKHRTIQEVLLEADVRWRCERILNEQQHFEAVLRAQSRVEGSVVVTDLRSIHPQPVGSRFLVYALFPECNASIKLYPSANRDQEVGISLGHSIFNRTQQVNVGAVCARFGGGGHRGAASCVVRADQADQIAAEMLKVLQASPPSPVS